MRETAEASLTQPSEMAELAALYDIYGPLLKETQKAIFEAYILDNLSLSEISGEYEMTRQGVYDMINRTRKKLREYDEKLGLRQKYAGILDLIRTADMDGTEKAKLTEQVERIL